MFSSVAKKLHGILEEVKLYDAFTQWFYPNYFIIRIKSHNNAINLPCTAIQRNMYFSVLHKDSATPG